MMLPWSCWAPLLLCAAAQFWGFLGLGTSLEELESPPDLGTPQHVPLEVTTGDEQFQAEAKRWKLPPLDSNHHQEGQEKLQEKLTGRLRLGLETSDLHWPALDETLITGGQHQMTQLMEDTNQPIGNVSGRGAMGCQEGHQVILSDLYYVQERAQGVYSQLESNLALLLAQQHQMEVVMEKLWQMNQSLGLALVALEGAQNHLENHLQHLKAVQDSAGQNSSVISSCILHGCYFVLLVVLLVLTLPCAILLLFLASSALGELLGIPALFSLLVLAVAGKWLLVATCRDAGGAWLVVPPEKLRPQLTSTPEREREMELLQEELDRMEMSCLQEPSCLEQPPVTTGNVPGLAGRVSPIPAGWRRKLSSCGMMVEPTMGAGKHWEPNPYVPSHSLASDVSLLSQRSLCQGLTRIGQPCRKKAIPGQDFCHIHTNS